MTQIEKIKAEVERLKEICKTNIIYTKESSFAFTMEMTGYDKILSFINSLPQEEVSEEFELAAERYACKFSSSKYGHDKIKKAYTAGANWQKEQMMAKAVDGEVGYWNIRGLSVNMELPSKYKEGDKVKLIIVKED